MEIRTVPALRAPDRTESGRDGRTLTMIWQANDGTGRIVEVSTSHWKSSRGFRSSILPAVETVQHLTTGDPAMVAVVQSTAYSVSPMDSVSFCSIAAPRFSQKALRAAADAALAALPGLLSTNTLACNWFTAIGSLPNSH